MWITILRFYLATVSVTLIMDMLTTARSNYYGLSIKGRQIITAIVCAVIPLANLIVAYDNLTMLFDKRDRFIIRFMFTRDRMDEVKLIDNEEEKEE